MEKTVLRMLDANFNRSREGLRVCEDVCRFILSAPREAALLRSLRHQITRVSKKFPLKGLLDARDSQNDSGRPFNRLEKNRSSWRDLYFANLQRSKEALRVLEEGTKIAKPGEAKRLKGLRFKLYDHEKLVYKKF